MNKKYLAFGIIGAVLIIVIVFFIFRSSEDSWIQDSRGVWIKHGSPARIPEEVLAQQILIVCANNLYNQTSFENLSSQCLGSCDAYAVDVVHVPRITEDDLDSNQCETYIRGQLKHFIELDKNGEIVRIV